MDFSKTGRTVRSRGLTLIAIGGRGVAGNFMNETTREKYRVAGVKQRGSNARPDSPMAVLVDEDAREEYERLRRV